MIEGAPLGRKKQNNVIKALRVDPKSNKWLDPESNVRQTMRVILG